MAAGDTVKQAVGSQEFKMLIVKGGTFTMGCTDNVMPCEAGGTEDAAHSVTLNYDYYISEFLVTNALWVAVMGGTAPGSSQAQMPKTNITWYDAVEFTCKLSEITKKKYRLPTEAEWEFAARGGNPGKTNNYKYSGSNTASEVAWVDGDGTKAVGGKKANELGLYDMSGNVYEWTFDNWASTYSSGAVTNPLQAHQHTQKTRRGGSGNQPASEARVSARKIRSIEGKDGEIGFRLALSVADSRPTNMDDPCNIHQPPPTGGKIGLRDERLITADGEIWVNSQMGNYGLVVKEDGTARMAMIYNGSAFDMAGGSAQGQWYTLNCFSLHIVSNSGTTTKYAYYLVNRNTLSIISEAAMPVGRFVRKSFSEANVTSFTISAITSPKTPEQLAPAGGTVDMANPPTNGRDSRLIKWPSQTWLQDNVAMGAGGTHRYRTDFFSDDSMSFVVYDIGAVPRPTSITLSAGKWFTVGNTFLRVRGCPDVMTYPPPTTKPCYDFDYLYTVGSDGKFYHISFQEYEPGDFRMFENVSVNNVPGWLEPTGFYYQGHSTYLPPTVEGYGDPQDPSSIKERERRVP
jgi:formylglycine-generating enzyme required for sulfatase activity